MFQLFAKTKDKSHKTKVKKSTNQLLDLNIETCQNDGRFSIDLVSSLTEEKSMVTIISLTGKTVYYGILTVEETSRQFDLSDSASGTYILMVTNGNSIATTKKFIKN